MYVTKKFQEMNDIGYMYKQWLKNKVMHKQRVVAWIWGLTGITFARRKGITIAH
jgi:hypothetical protein